MIHCLHGAVGSHKDWTFLREDWPDLNAVNLWRFFEQDNPSLTQAGQKICDLANQDDILIGYSMGGRLALHALLAAPQKWKAAVIISAHPGLTTGYDKRRQSDQLWSQLPGQEWPAFLDQWNKQGILKSKPTGFHQAEFADREAVSKSFTHWSLGKQADLRPRLPLITSPLLWITGELDQKFRTLADEVTPLLPNAQARIIKNSGHRVPWEEPAAFRDEIRKFLKNLP